MDILCHNYGPGCPSGFECLGSGSSKTLLISKSKHNRKLNEPPDKKWKRSICHRTSHGLKWIIFYHFSCFEIQEYTPVLHPSAKHVVPSWGIAAVVKRSITPRMSSAQAFDRRQFKPWYPHALEELDIPNTGGSLSNLFATLLMAKRCEKPLLCKLDTCRQTIPKHFWHDRSSDPKYVCSLFRFSLAVSL